MAVTAIILCGGAGERMQGAEKPLQTLLGRPLVERALQAVRPQVSKVVLVANRRLEDYAALGVSVVDDGAFKGKGPLAGIAAGLAAATTDWAICVPADAPLLPGDLAAQLEQALARDQADLAVVHDGSGRQPLCCLLPRRLLPELRHYLDGGGTAPREWQSRYRVAEADYAQWPRWAWSLNTAEEWRFAETQLSQHREGT